MGTSFNKSGLSIIKNKLKNKKVIFAMWDADNKTDYPYQCWYLPLSKFFDNIILFDPRKQYFNLGKEKMNQNFLDIIAKEKPDYVFLLLIYDEFYMETFEKIRKISPNTRTINYFSDEAWRFQDYSRYYIPFLDYSIIPPQLPQKCYTEDGLENFFYVIGVNHENFRPIQLSKKYDVTFVGRSDNHRVEMIKFLLKNNMNVRVWGHNWNKHPEFKDIYGGSLESNELAKVINQSKINLNFTVGGYGEQQLKIRPFEIFACGSFMLSEYFEGYLNFFKENKEIVMFMNQEDLLKKIKYYLKNEKEREKIAKAARKKTVTNFTQEIVIAKMFQKIFEQEKKGISRELPKLNKKIIYLFRDDLNSNLKEKVKSADYVCFNREKCKISKYRDFIQAYSLEKSGKKISCCDYYVNSYSLGNYLLFKAKRAFEKISSLSFNSLIVPEQIMVSKDYFLKNIHVFTQFLNKKNSILIKKDNTIFVSIPLITIKKIHALEYSVMKEAFQMKFLDKLYSLYNQKKFFSLYPAALFLNSLKNHGIILKVIKETVRDSDKLKKLKSLN